jgi:hypothetical protein
MLPWLVVNIPNGLFSLRAIPRQPVGLGTSAGNLVRDQLPILVGAAGRCGHTVIPAAVAGAAVAALMLALLWTRRRSLEYIVTGHWTGISQIDVALLVIPVTAGMVVIGGLNPDPCAAQSLVPIAVPLALGAASILIEHTRWRIVAAVVAALWLAVSAVTASGTLLDQQPVTTSGTALPNELAPGVALLRQHPAPVWAGYALSRLLSYYSHDTLAIGEYGGDVGFIKRQQQVETALDPSWVFVAGDPDIARFLKACTAKSIRYTLYSGGGLDLYAGLSGSLEPGDVFTGPEAQTS